MIKNKIKQEQCFYCKWYKQDDEVNDFGLEISFICNATNNANLKGFPFKTKLKCFEIDDRYEFIP